MSTNMNSSSLKIGDKVNWSLGIDSDWDGAEIIGIAGNEWPYELRSKHGKTTYASADELTLVAAAGGADAGGARVKVGDRVRNRRVPKAGIGIIEKVKPEGGYQVFFKDTWFGRCHDTDESLVPTTTLTVQPGKYYRTRDGRKVGPMERTGRVWTDGRGQVAAFRSGSSGDYAANGIWLTSDGTESFDLIAQWGDEPVDEQPAKASNDNAEKPTKTAGYTVPLCAFEDGGSVFEVKDGKVTFRTQTIRVVSNQPAIVCLIEHGQPKPAGRPHVHRNKAAAGKEAERLAKKYPGKRFGVYEFVQSAEVAKPVIAPKTYKHEWQRLAAEGLDVSAASALAKLAGLSWGAAHRAVLAA